MKKVIIYHSPLTEESSKDDLDVMDQARHVSAGLRKLGYDPVKKPFQPDISLLKEELEEHQPLFIFNLVETIEGDGRLIAVAPLMFEHLRIPYTGCGSDAVYLTSNKILAKKIMQSYNIPTPAYYGPGDLSIPGLLPGRGFLIKSVWEHASYGLDEQHLKLNDGVQVRSFLKNLKKDEQQYFAEQYIEGREFNVTVIGGHNGPVVLPVAEIEFRNYPQNKLKVVGYRAKWDEESFEYKNTVRAFNEDGQDDALFARIREICIQCWTAFGLKGYARVDFRVDEQDQPFVLEINSNPCISPDSGFIAATKQADMDFNEVLERIIYDTIE